MIGRLQGRPVDTQPDAVLLDIQGVGYAVQIPLSTYYEIEGATGEIALHIHTHVRAEAIELFGFWTAREKLLFEKLISVSGIGPKLARVILSGMSPDDLVSALAQSDIAKLSGIPGIGKKTAERMVVDLREKVQELASDLPEEATPASSEEDDLVLALVNLGYREREAEKAVTAARAEAPEAAFRELLRASLQRLSRV